MYVAPNDPSAYTGYGYCSYLLNTAVFDANLAVQQISDGTSNTVLVAEGYASCYGYTYTSNPYKYIYSSRYSYWPGYYYDYTYSSVSHYDWTGTYYIAIYGPTYDYTYSYSYYTPKFSPTGKTFQVKPSTSQCDGTVPQGLSSGVLMALLGDASVKGCGSNMSGTTWSAALT